MEARQTRSGVTGSGGKRIVIGSECGCMERENECAREREMGKRGKVRENKKKRGKVRN